MRRTLRYCLALMLPTALVAGEFYTPRSRAACCYFSAKDKDIVQPAQKAFITWEPKQQRESFTVQPRFEGNAADFGMVVPTPSKPELHEMPRDFFKELAVFTILKRREFAQSKLLPPRGFGALGALGGGGFAGGFGGGGFGGVVAARPPAVKVLEAGIVGSLDYKIIKAGRADDLFKWLKDNQYHYTGDEETLHHYVKKSWFFTVMKIDTLQMKRNADGTYLGDVTPTRFDFASEKPVYSLRITRLSVKDQTEALFYIQAPFKADLPGDLTFQYQWVPLLRTAQGSYAKGTPGPSSLPGKGDAWLRAIRDQTPDIQEKGASLGFSFISGQRPVPNREGRTPTTLEWAKRLTAQDVQVLRGDGEYSDKVPNVDDGFTADDLDDARNGPAAKRTIQGRLDKSRREKPGGYLVREAPRDEVRNLKILVGHLHEGEFVTKLRKTFTKDEMADDLILVPARVGGINDKSEYEEVLPTSPP
jgi:hypothetical protein